MNARSNSIQWGAAAVGLLVLGAAAGYWGAQRASVSPQLPAQAPRKILYWQDPMTPGRRFDKPGKSPYMDMDLVPVYADEASGNSGVRIDARVAQNLGIRLGKVEKAVLSSRLHAVGSVTFDERLLEVMQARVEGYVTRLQVKTPLERVRRGQPLATLLVPQWQEAQQEYLALLDASSESAKAIRDAARRRLMVLGVPQATIQNIESTRKADATTTVLSPLDGVVTELGVREGAAFGAGASLFRINGLGTVWVNAQIPEASVSMIPPGTTVRASVTGWPDATFEGRVMELLPQLDSQTRTVTARVALDNTGFKLSPGMFASLDFSAPAGAPQLVVPSEAVIATGERTVVVVARDGGVFEVVKVSVGADKDGRTAILSGLKEDESVVLSGQFLIDSEASLRSAVSRLAPTPTLPRSAGEGAR